MLFTTEFYTGGVYIYALYEASNWQLEQYLSSPGGPTSGYGRSVAMFANNIVVGTGVGAGKRCYYRLLG